MPRSDKASIGVQVRREEGRRSIGTVDLQENDLPPGDEGDEDEEEEEVFVALESEVGDDEIDGTFLCANGVSMAPTSFWPSFIIARNPLSLYTKCHVAKNGESPRCIN